MNTKYRYSTIGLLSAIANAILIIGGGSLVLSAGSIALGNLFSILNATSIVIYLFLSGLVATFVAGLYQILYYIFQNRQKAALFGGVGSLLSFCIYLFALSSFITSIMSQSVLSFFSDKSSVSTGGIWLAFIISVVVFLFNGAVLLQMKGIIHISFLGDMLSLHSIPSKTANIQTEPVDKDKIKLEEGEENEKTI